MAPKVKTSISTVTTVRVLQSCTKQWYFFEQKFSHPYQTTSGVFGLAHGQKRLNICYASRNREMCQNRRWICGTFIHNFSIDRVRFSKIMCVLKFHPEMLPEIFFKRIMDHKFELNMPKNHDVRSGSEIGWNLSKQIIFEHHIYRYRETMSKSTQCRFFHISPLLTT